MKRKAAYMFISAYIKEPQRTVLDLGASEEIIIGVGSYGMACREAKNLLEEGVAIIELCGGFGTIGHGKVVEAVEGKIQIGVVRYDNHPGYNGESGDVRWLQV